MSNYKKALIGAVSVILVSTNSYAGEIGHVPISANHILTYDTHIVELKPIASPAYQVAGLKFLPEITDSEVSWSGNSISNSANKGNNCGGYTLTSCPANGTCSSCPFDRRYKRLISCANGYTKTETGCKASSCSAIGYESSIPDNKICTKISDSGLTCYKDCRAVSCSGYTLNCDTFNVANSASKAACPDCESANAKCSPKLCKVSSCMSGYKIADNGTTCVALDDNCPTNYYKTCETSVIGDPVYTEAKTPCYQCKPKITLSDCSALKQAVENAGTGGTITMDADVTCADTTITLGEKQILDGKNHTLTFVLDNLNEGLILASRSSLKNLNMTLEVPNNSSGSYPNKKLIKIPRGNIENTIENVNFVLDNQPDKGSFAMIAHYSGKGYGGPLNLKGNISFKRKKTTCGTDYNYLVTSDYYDYDVNKSVEGDIVNITDAILNAKICTGDVIENVSLNIIDSTITAETNGFDSSAFGGVYDFRMRGNSSATITTYGGQSKGFWFTWRSSCPNGGCGQEFYMTDNSSATIITNGAGHSISTAAREPLYLKGSSRLNIKTSNTEPIDSFLSIIKQGGTLNISK